MYLIHSEKKTEFCSIMIFSIKMAKCSRVQPSGNDVRRPRSLLPPLPDVRAAYDAGAPQPALWQGRQDHGEISVKDRYLRTWAVAMFHNHNSVLIMFCHFNFYSLIYELTKHIHRTTALTNILPPSSVRGTASWRTCTQRARCPTPNTPSFQNGLTISCLARNLTSM